MAGANQESESAHRYWLQIENESIQAGNRCSLYTGGMQRSQIVIWLYISFSECSLRDHCFLDLTKHANHSERSEFVAYLQDDNLGCLLLLLMGKTFRRMTLNRQPGL